MANSTGPKIDVFITTFNRPRFLLVLLKEIIAQAHGRDLRVIVIDDYSDCDYSDVASFALKHRDKIRLIRREKRYGYEGFAKTYDEIFERARKDNADFFFVFQDIVTLESGFFDRALAYWKSIPDQGKIALNIPRDARSILREWSGIFPGVVEKDGYCSVVSGWIEGIWMGSKRTLELLAQTAESDQEPSGDGGYHSCIVSFFHRRGCNIYTPDRPLVRPTPLQKRPATGSFRVFVPTYNRAANLLRLLDEIEAESGGHEVVVSIYDDCSSEDYSEICHRASENPHRIVYRRLSENRGKQKFWMTYNDMLDEMRQADEQYMLFLQDDAHICADFFTVLLDHWNAISDEKKIALNFQRDNRGIAHLWRGKDVAHMNFDGRQLLLSGWLDGFWFGDRETLEALSCSVYPIDPERWEKNPAISSGVGQQISERLARAGYNIYMTAHSLVRMIQCPSFMNPAARQELPLVEVNYYGSRDDNRCGLL